MALDRTMVSDRDAIYVQTETVRSIGQRPEEFNIHCSSIQDMRQSHRKLLTETLKVEFQTDVPLIVHWDGKLLRDLTTKQHIDRLSIIVTGGSQLLEVAMLANGTGSEQNKTVIAALNEWGLKEKVAGLSFDTTAANTVQMLGACALVEQELQKDLLYLSCSHHILKLLAETAFTTLMSPKGQKFLFLRGFKIRGSLLTENQMQLQLMTRRYLISSMTQS